jgi:molecular chaperone DnaK
MDPVLGIDLGTTNSVVSIVQDGKPVTLRDGRGRATLPSVVGLDPSGQLLVGEQARNQALVAPERTVQSIKRKMGTDVKVPMGDQEYAPQEISAMILRTLARQAEAELGRPLTQAVITVPAFFNDMQREATREAGRMAGLDVLRIINEPTAATLVYEPHSARNEKLLVYDLGGGTFDVSVVQIESGVIEVLASHGDTHLGGDDFDQLLLDHVADAFLAEHQVDLRDNPVSKSRLLRAVEEAKIRLSTDIEATIALEFIIEKAGSFLNLEMTIDRGDYEQLITPLLTQTLTSVDTALEDAGLTPEKLDRVVLVGGSSRTPLVHQLLREQLHKQLDSQIDPDLCVSLGAAVQGALIAGQDVGPILVDITPHTLGIQCLGELYGMPSDEVFSPIIARNSPLPASRSQIYYTAFEGQKAVEIHVLQGENEVARFNQSIGRFMLEGLDERASEGSEILVRFDLNLDGILKVVAQERVSGLSRDLVIDNAVTRFRATSGVESQQRLAELFDDADDSPIAVSATSSSAASEESDEARQTLERAQQSLAKARRVVADVKSDDADEVRDLIDRLDAEIHRRDIAAVESLREQLDDLIFYLQDA